ncbi:hypothetical protein [Terrabacter carboxydivorans]
MKPVAVPAIRTRRVPSAPSVLTRAAMAVLACALVLTGCTSQSGRPEPAPRSSAPGAYSLLDEAGVAQIRASRTIRLDMRSGRLEKTSVGLDPAVGLGPDIDTRRSGTLRLTISTPSGEIGDDTGYVRFDTTSGRTDFREVTYFLTATSLDELARVIRDGVDRYGIDRASAERWIESTELRPKSRSSFSITSGTSTGVSVNYDVRYDGTKATQVVIVHVNPID